ncbi:MAG: type II secretion system F family protein, partial [Candidatus Aenigmatarchaeota archaeon]
MLKYLYESIFIVIGAVIITFNLLYLEPLIPLFAPLVNVLGGLIAVVPTAILLYTRYKLRREMEVQFLVFIRDLTDSINTGMTLPLALENCAKRNYMALSKYVNDMASQVNWGIPFEKALKTFAKKTNLITIKRAVTTIIETYKVGGKISDTLTAVGKSLMTIDKIKQERTTSVHGQVIISYLIYFVFIFILIVLQVFLIPALVPAAGAVPGVSFIPTGVPTPTQVYTHSFVNFIIIQGFFAGLMT